MPLSQIRDIYEVDELIPLIPKNLNGNGHLYNFDLSFNGIETQHSTHSLHTYVAAINPPLVKSLLQTYFSPSDYILDPYCGGGGVLVESILNGNSCAGFDVNPLGVLITKAKTTYIPKEKIEKAMTQIISIAKDKVYAVSPQIDEKTKFWFKEYMLPYLAALGEAIKEVTADDIALKNLFQAVLSATIRDVMLTYRGEVRLRKLTGKDLEKFNPDIFKAFLRRTTLALERVPKLPKHAKAEAIIADIRKIPYTNGRFTGIICSPPYADDKNGVGYFQFSRNMLAWLGFDGDEIKKYKAMFLGADKQNKIPPKSASLQKSLDNVKSRDEKQYAEAVAFYHDYNDGLVEMARVTKKWIIIVIGNRVLSRTQFNNAAITVDLFKNIGVALEHHYMRDLKKKRIANLGSDGGGIAKEHVLVFAKYLNLAPIGGKMPQKRSLPKER